MYCPNCKAEYRPGFTHCVDCDVDLVPEAPGPGTLALYADDPASAPGEPGDPNKDPFCSFWKGEDPRVHAELCSVLDEAGIPHNTVFRHDHLFNMKNYPAYEVGVPFSLFERAENSVKEAFSAGDPEGVDSGEFQTSLLDRDSPIIPKLPETLTPPPEQTFPGPPTAGEGTDWFPEDATVKVWSGDPDERGDFLVAALHENGINCRLDKTGRREELYVLPEDEPPAREIVREVVEGLPPE
jgi:hypothetical protein